LTGDGAPEKLFGAKVTANLFSVLGVEPMIGRTFRPEDDRPGGDRAVMLSYGLWVRRFGSDRQIAGKQVRLDGANCTITGVMPKSFQFPDRDGEFWLPIQLKVDEAANKDSHYLQVVARLKPGITPAQADSDLAGIMRSLAEEFPNTNAKVGAYTISLREEFAGTLRVALFIC
jgi:putative ABC transport system permease protein